MHICNMRQLLIFLLSCVVLSACGGQYSVKKDSNFTTTLGDSDTIAVYGDGFVLTAGDYMQALNRSHLVLWGGEVEPAIANDFRDSLILDSLAGYDAKNVDLEQHYSSYRTYQQLYYDFLVKSFWEEEVYYKVSVDSLQIVNFYNENKELFSVDEQMDLHHILVSSASFRTGPDSIYYRSLSVDALDLQLKEYADELYRLLGYGEPFDNVAYLFSHDVDAKDKAGHVGWTIRNTYLDPFDSIAFSLKAGSYSEPYRDKDGWHLIYSGGYQPEGPVPIDSSQVYESARQSLLTHLSNQVSTDLMDSLVGLLELKVNDLILDTNIYLVDDSIWAAIVNNIDTIDCRRFKRYEESYRKKFDVRNTNSDMKQSMLRDASYGFLLIQHARTVGIESLTKVVDERNRIWHHRTKIITARQAFDPIWDPTQEQVEEYYESHLDVFLVKKPLTLEMLTVQDSTFSLFLREQALTGIDFEQLAKEQSDVTGINIKYDRIGNVGESDISRPIFFAGMNTQIGNISHIFKRGEEFSILHVIDRKDSKTLLYAKGGIKVILKHKHQREVWYNHRDQIFREHNVHFPTELPPIVLKRRLERLPEPTP